MTVLEAERLFLRELWRTHFDPPAAILTSPEELVDRLAKEAR